MASLPPSSPSRKPTPRDRREYVRITVDLPTNPKLIAAPVQAKWLHVVGICYAGQHLTNGHVPVAMALTLASATKKHADALIRSGIWHLPGHDCDRCPDPDEGWVYIHDYTEHQRTREQAEKARKDGRKAADARWGKGLRAVGE